MCVFSVIFLAPTTAVVGDRMTRCSRTPGKFCFDRKRCFQIRLLPSLEVCAASYPPKKTKDPRAPCVTQRCQSRRPLNMNANRAIRRMGSNCKDVVAPPLHALHYFQTRHSNLLSTDGNSTPVTPYWGIKANSPLHLIWCTTNTLNYSVFQPAGAAETIFHRSTYHLLPLFSS